jgi:hypothetical protein
MKGDLFIMIKNRDDLKKAVDTAVKNVRITDVHTHLFTNDFSGFLLWGVDELVTYHYLIAEVMRFTDIPYEKYWNMTKKEQADFIWDTLFIKNTPYSEACRGVLTTLEKLGLDVSSRNLDAYRAYFKGLSAEEYIDRVLKISGVESLVMTNDPFEDEERRVWLKGFKGDERFKAALRIDPLVNSWDKSFDRLKEWGYEVCEELNEKTIDEIRRFLSEWIDRMEALYMAVSLPPSFVLPEKSKRAKIIEECIIPVAREKNIPFAMMIGVKKLANPKLRVAGDSVGKSDINSVEYLCSKYPENKFLVTMLSRENQHELCVSARKFRNLMIFGCWWFMNNPLIIEEITRMRLELLGTGFIPQHSDARVLDQLIYKWSHSKEIIGSVLYDKYCGVLDTGWAIKGEEITRDVEKLFGRNFWNFIGK